MDTPRYQMTVFLLAADELSSADQPEKFRALLDAGWEPFGYERTEHEASAEYGQPLQPVYRVWLRRALERPA